MDQLLLLLMMLPMQWEMVQMVLLRVHSDGDHICKHRQMVVQHGNELFVRHLSGKCTGNSQFNCTTKYDEHALSRSNWISQMSTSIFILVSFCSDHDNSKLKL